MARLVASVVQGGRQTLAFLDMLAWSEIGPELLAESDDGYNVLVGSTPAHPLLFSPYKDHPDVYNPRMNSTAAGRYQILSRYWPHYKTLLKLPDFGPESQDGYAVQQLVEQGALPHIDRGDLRTAIDCVCDIWASLAGSPWGQHENPLSGLREAFVAAGGTVQDKGESG